MNRDVEKRYEERKLSSHMTGFVRSRDRTSGIGLSSTSALGRTTDSVEAATGHPIERPQ